MEVKELSYNKDMTDTPRNIWFEAAIESIVDNSAADEHISQSLEEVIEPFLGTVDQELVECLAVVVREYQKRSVDLALKTAKLTHTVKI